MRRGSGSPSQSPAPESSSRFVLGHRASASVGGASASATSPRIIRPPSPSRPILPPLHPLPLGSAQPPASSQGGERGGGSGSSSSYQSFGAAGSAVSQQPPPPGSWAPNWSAGHMSRHSIDAPTHINLKSPSPGPTSPERQRTERERDREGPRARDPAREKRASEPSTTNGPDIVFTRDVTNRQPRSMMACMRCRRQK